MKKKLVIGCIFTVALLSLLPLSSVIGIQKSAYNKNGVYPLFAIRNKMALNEEYCKLTYDYIGKDIDNNIPIPNRNSKLELIDRFVNNIRLMNDGSFDKLLDLLIRQGHQRNDLQRYSIEKITQSF